MDIEPPVGNFEVDGHRRLRILHVVATYFPAVRYGGPIRSVHGLAVALVQRGHDVHVYTTNVDGDENLDVPLGTPVVLDGVKVHYFPVPALRRLLWSPEMATALRQSIRQFDVAHLHAVFLWPMQAAARVAARAGVPYVVAPRGMLIRDAIRGKSRFVKTAWINLIERTTLARASAIHTTADIEELELQALRLPARNPRCIPNGVEVPGHFVPLSATPFAGLPPHYGLFLSRISWKKGLDRLIPAWKSVPDIPLVIAGNDEENYRPQLEALARNLGIADRVIFLGPVSDAHKWALYAGAQLFVLPSYSENFGNVVAEAMAMACPVVLTRDVGIAPLVEAARAGVVIAGAPDEIASVVNRLLGDSETRADMGRRGAEFVRHHLEWGAIAAQIEALYRSVAVVRAPLAVSAAL